MPHLNAALRKGARILFTSRTYIYRAALSEIKESAFPLLRDSKVVINVEELTHKEKERILYNHLRLGTQPTEFRSQIKGFLPSIASSKQFFPEIAKRLSDPFFTKNLDITKESLQRFVEEPKEFLFDVIKELNRANFASLCLLFMRGGQVQIPPTLEPTEIGALELVGASVAQTLDGFRALEGSLVSIALEGGEHSWKFRHPSVRDAMALHVAERPELLDIYLGGVKASELLREIVCGDQTIAGAKVYIPKSRFETVAKKIHQIKLADWSTPYKLLQFLSTRCSNEFLLIWTKLGDEQLYQLCSQFSTKHLSFCTLLSKLEYIHQLPVQIREWYVQQVDENLSSEADATFLQEEIRNLLTKDEFSHLIKKIKNEVAHSIDRYIENLESEYSDHEHEPSDYFSDLRSNFNTFQDFFSNDEKLYSAFEIGIDEIDSAVERLEERNEEAQREREAEEAKEKEEREEQEKLEELMNMRMRSDRDRERQTEDQRLPVHHVNMPPRSIFDDVDA